MDVAPFKDDHVLGPTRHDQLAVALETEVAGAQEPDLLPNGYGAKGRLALLGPPPIAPSHVLSLKPDFSRDAVRTGDARGRIDDADRDAVRRRAAARVDLRASGR